MDFLTHSCEKLKLVVTYAFIFEVLNICWRMRYVLTVTVKFYHPC